MRCLSSILGRPQRVCVKAFFACNMWADAVAIARKTTTDADDLMLRCYDWFIHGKVRTGAMCWNMCKR